jgi:hypothetical protein
MHIADCIELHLAGLHAEKEKKPLPKTPKKVVGKKKKVI